MEDPNPFPYSYQQSYAMTAKPKRRWPWIVGGIGLGCLGIFLLGALVIGAGVWMELSAKESSLAAAEREMLLDAEAVAAWLDYTPDPSKEKAVRKTYFDKSFALEYEYDDTATEDGIYINYSLHYERKKSDAVALYMPMWESTRLGLKIGGTADFMIEEHNELLRWGERSRFGIVYNGTAPVGNVFVAQAESRVVYLLLSGVYFEEAEAISELVSPYLEQVDQLSAR